MDDIDRVFHAESQFIASCADVHTLSDKLAVYRAAERTAAERGNTKGRLRCADLLELVEDRIVELKAATLRRTPALSRSDAGPPTSAVTRTAEREHPPADPPPLSRSARDGVAPRTGDDERRVMEDRERCVQRARQEAAARRRMAEEAAACAPQNAYQRANARLDEIDRSRIPLEPLPAPGSWSTARAPAPRAELGAPVAGPPAPVPSRASHPPAPTAPPRSAESPHRAPVQRAPVKATPAPPDQDPLFADLFAQQRAAAPATPIVYTGADLANYRAGHGLTQRLAAVHFGVAHGTIAKAEMEPGKALGEALQAGMRNVVGRK